MRPGSKVAKTVSEAVALPFVIVCIALDAVAQTWVEWKRMLWGELGMAVREKISLTIRKRMR